jgi:hypothetical protein
MDNFNMGETFTSGSEDSGQFPQEFFLHEADDKILKDLPIPKDVIDKLRDQISQCITAIGLETAKTQARQTPSDQTTTPIDYDLGHVNLDSAEKLLNQNRKNDLLKKKDQRLLSQQNSTKIFGYICQEGFLQHRNDFNLFSQDFLNNNDNILEIFLHLNKSFFRIIIANLTMETDQIFHDKLLGAIMGMTVTGNPENFDELNEEFVLTTKGKDTDNKLEVLSYLERKIDLVMARMMARKSEEKKPWKKQATVWNLMGRFADHLRNVGIINTFRAMRDGTPTPEAGLEKLVFPPDNEGSADPEMIVLEGLRTAADKRLGKLLVGNFGSFLFLDLTQIYLKMLDLSFFLKIQMEMNYLITADSKIWCLV